MTTADGQILARWHGSLENPVCSPLEFLQMVEQEIIEKGLPNISFSYITRHEGGWFSPQRIYLRIKGYGLFFDITAFPEGNSLVVSWWLHRQDPNLIDLFSELPLIGYVLRKTIRAETYYTVDTVEHFQDSIAASVTKVLRNLDEQNGFEYSPDTKPEWEGVW